MNPMVLKYVALTGIVYGIHLFLSIVQLVLCLFLIANGILLLSRKNDLSVWPARLGLKFHSKVFNRKNHLLLQLRHFALNLSFLMTTCGKF